LKKNYSYPPLIIMTILLQVTLSNGELVTPDIDMSGE